MDFNTKASMAVKALEKLIAEYGDLPICADDPDTSYRLPIGIVFKPADKIEGWPARFEIKTEYHYDPKGMI